MVYQTHLYLPDNQDQDRQDTCIVIWQCDSSKKGTEQSGIPQLPAVIYQEKMNLRTVHQGCYSVLQAAGSLVKVDLLATPTDGLNCLCPQMQSGPTSSVLANNKSTARQAALPRQCTSTVRVVLDCLWSISLKWPIFSTAPR